MSSSDSSGSDSDEHHGALLEENRALKKQLVLYEPTDKKRASGQQTRDRKAKKVRKLAKKLNFLAKQLSNSSSESEEESSGGDDEADSDTDGRSEYSRGPYFELMYDLLEYVNQVKEVNADSLLKIAQSGDNVTDKYRFLMTFLDLHCNFDVDEGQFRDEASHVVTEGLGCDTETHFVETNCN
eukprot:gene9907-11733_t